MYNEQLGSPYLIMHGIMLISLEGGGKMGDIAASKHVSFSGKHVFFPTFSSFFIFCFSLFPFGFL